MNKTILKAFVKTALKRTIIEVVFFFTCYDPIWRDIFLFRKFLNSSSTWWFSSCAPHATELFLSQEDESSFSPLRSCLSLSQRIILGSGEYQCPSWCFCLREEVPVDISETLINMYPISAVTWEHEENSKEHSWFHWHAFSRSFLPVEQKFRMGNWQTITENPQYIP